MAPTLHGLSVSNVLRTVYTMWSVWADCPLECGRPPALATAGDMMPTMIEIDMNML